VIAADPSTEAIVASAIVAVLCAVGLLLRVLFKYLNRREEAHDTFAAEQRGAHETAMGEQRAAFTSFLGNHMSSSTKAMSDVALNLERLTAEIRELRARQ
jgi:flagellar biosynthesis/type III secretory pathway M-ring protein FliF/YscJ